MIRISDGIAEELSEKEVNRINENAVAAMRDALAQAEAEEKRRPLTAEEVSAMLIRQQINNLVVDDTTALRMVEYYPAPDAASYAAGDRIQYNGKLYKCLQAHTAQAGWNPVDAPSLWAEVLAGQDGTEIGEWVQPDSTNPYMRGDRVSYNGKIYESEVDNNVWAPGVYGWAEII